MAAIGRIRKHSVLAMTIIGIALLCFILGDLGKSSGRQNKYYNVGIVDGEKISANDFNNEVDRITTIRSYNTDKKTLDQMAFSIKESVWNQMVQDVFLNREYQKLDVKVTSDEMNDLIRGPEPHQYIKSFPYFTNKETGKVDYEYINKFLENLNNEEMVPAAMKNYYLYVESMVRKETGESKYNNLISKGYYVPKAFAKKDYTEKNTNYQVTFVSYNYKNLSDSMFKASKEELNKYYQEHKKEFKTKEARDLAYVEYDIQPTPQDRSAIISDVNGLYAEFQTTDNVGSFISAESETPFDTTWKQQSDLNPAIASYVFSAQPGSFISPYQDNEIMYFAKVLKIQNRPDSLKASHILIAYQGAANTGQNVKRTKVQAKQLADSIANAIKKSPEAFAQMATKYSDDGSVKDNNGDIGWFSDGTMVYPFNEYVINNGVGTVGVVETTFGYHVVKIDDKTASHPKVQLALFSRSIVPSNKTYQEAFMHFSAFASKCKTFDDLMLAASDKGYNVKYYDKATRMSAGLGNIENSREIIRWAFGEDVKEKQVSNVYDLTDKLVVASVTKIYPDGYFTVDDVKDQITPLVIRDKKAEYIKKDLAQKIQGCTSIEQVAQKLNTVVDSAIVNGGISNLTKYGPESKVIGMMYAAPVNKLLGPIDGEQACYVFSKTLKSSPEPINDLTGEQRRLEMYVTNRMTRLAVKTMQDDAKIVDNRDLFY